jgi:hypothetical protein
VLEAAILVIAQLILLLGLLGAVATAVGGILALIALCLPFI